MKTVELRYGMQGILEHTNPGDDRRGVYVGVDEHGTHVVLRKVIDGINAYRAKKCIAIDDGVLRFFLRGGEVEVRELDGAEKDVAEKILQRRLQS